MRSLAALFGRSPFKPLQEHMIKVVECAGIVPPLFEALIAGDLEALVAHRARISALESEADAIKNELRSHLPRKLFMPIDRRDLLEILDLQDSIADVAEDIGDLLAERRFVVPEPMREPLLTFVARSVETAVAGEAVLDQLDQVVEVGFMGREVDRLHTQIDEVLRLEDESDDLELALTRVLFAHEDSMSPVSVILWLRIIDWIGDLADYPKKVCNRLRLLVAN